MGFGDVKLMGALGIYFGLSNIIVITLLSFLIGAILKHSIISNKNKKNGRIHTIWTIYSIRDIYQYICTIPSNKKYIDANIYIRLI